LGTFDKASKFHRKSNKGEGNTNHTLLSPLIPQFFGKIRLFLDDRKLSREEKEEKF
jgi:hypothetical protein